MLWAFVTMMFVLHAGNIHYSPLVGLLFIVVFVVMSFEIILRIIIKYGAVILPAKQPFLTDVRKKLAEAALYGIFMPRFVPHPFLQFTLPRRDLENGDSEMGFKKITLHDIPKPPGTIRIACLGNSTCAEYPQLLEQFLNKTCPQTKFQVLDFGMGWWSSLHSTVNFILNVIDFNPDYVVLHDNCNDHNYRGYPGLRGDAAHAYHNLTVPPSLDVYWSRLFVLYRVSAVLVKRRFPRFLRRHYSMEKSILNPGKKYQYDPKELFIFERNFETIYAVSKHRNIKLCVMTFPFSNVLKYGEDHDKVYRPHMRNVNEMLRRKAAQYGLLLIDAAQYMTGEEDLFWDAIHVVTKGNMIKSYLIACKILKDLNLPLLLEGDWKEIDNWIKEKSVLADIERRC
ncbi:MAG: SGNH/GDSL hydrolase family protein [Syntrophomonas sp.]